MNLNNVTNNKPIPDQTEEKKEEGRRG